MPEIKTVELHRIIALRPAIDRHFMRGNGRRLLRLSQERQALIPERVNVLPTATHEVEYSGKVAVEALIASTEKSPSYCKRPKLDATIDLAAVKADEVLLLHLGKAGAFPRPNFSKVLYKDDRFYFVLTWSDFFGACIKECEPSFRTRVGRVVMLHEIHADLCGQLWQGLLAHPNVVGGLQRSAS